MFLHKLRLRNFKCFKDKTINFGHTTDIYGANGTGKSSVMDAYFWLLFGKDAEDREDFTVKPVDMSGRTNADAVTEVSGIFELCDGTKVELCRTLEENWAIPKGETEATFRGHVSRRYIDGVEVGVEEFENKISAMTAAPLAFGAGKKGRSVSVSKVLSNARYFNEMLHWTERKEVLFKIAPPISDADILRLNPELSGIEPAIRMGLDVYIAQETPKIKKLQAEMAEIPAKIEENLLSMPAQKDFAGIERDIAAKQELIAAHDANLFDMSKAFEAYRREQQEIFKLENAVADIDRRRESETAGLVSSKAGRIQRAQMELDNAKQRLRMSASAYESAKALLPEMEVRLKHMRGNHQALKTRTFTPPRDDDFICPTCKRPLDAWDIEAKTEELRKTGILNTRA